MFLSFCKVVQISPDEVTLSCRLTYIPFASKHSSARNLKSCFQSEGCVRHRKGLTQVLRWQGLAGSFTGKLDHISANAAQQHRHHIVAQSHIYKTESITSTPQATSSTVCVLNVHSLTLRQSFCIKWIATSNDQYASIIFEIFVVAVQY